MRSVNKGECERYQNQNSQSKKRHADASSKTASVNCWKQNLPEKSGKLNEA